MTHEFLEHTADIRMRVTGGSLHEAFQSAVAGMMQLLAPGSAAKPPGTEPSGKEPPDTKRSVVVAAPDATALLIDFLNAVLLQAETHRERYDKVEFRRLTEREVAAELTGTPVESFGEDIKAVTYHEADLRRASDGTWSTMVVFDI